MGILMKLICDQTGTNRRPRGSLEGPWVSLGGPWTLLGGSLEAPWRVLGGSLEGSLGVDSGTRLASSDLKRLESLLRRIPHPLQHFEKRRHCHALVPSGPSTCPHLVFTSLVPGHGHLPLGNLARNWIDICATTAGYWWVNSCGRKREEWS